MQSNLMDHGSCRHHTAALGPHPRQQSMQQSTNISLVLILAGAVCNMWDFFGIFLWCHRILLIPTWKNCVGTYLDFLVISSMQHEYQLSRVKIILDGTQHTFNLLFVFHVGISMN
jgi:hypothetical protein